ncbi:MAG: electron transfer flavoprotein subunit alpha/FixB family protein [Chloroflexi bacterium]|nr:electron transfer flavoprotein subunit alpha/FixB family protein [Chloroflexota bacterium]
MVESLYNVENENPAIWVFLEHHDGVLEGVSLELLSRGRQLADVIGWELTGLLIGHQVASLAEEAIALGADRVILAEHPLLEHFTVNGYVHVAQQALLEYQPSIFLSGATPDGRDLAGRLAVRMRTGLNADCTDLRLDPKTGILICEVSGFGGGVLALIEMETHRPQMATVRPGVFVPGEADSGRAGSLVSLEFDLPPEIIQTRVVERVSGESLDLTQLPILVCGGRGIHGHFEWMYELANLLGGDVGATRPPVDEGHIERQRQIGSTGAICRPKVAICFGISGAFHFIVGIQEADMVIAINNDPKAEIFDHADYCIVGDTHEIVPALIQEIRDWKMEVGD